MMSKTNYSRSEREPDSERESTEEELTQQPAENVSISNLFAQNITILCGNIRYFSFQVTSAVTSNSGEAESPEKDKKRFDPIASIKNMMKRKG